MNSSFHLFPESASLAAGRYDTLMLSLTALLCVVALAVLVAIAGSVIRYHEHRPADRSHPPLANKPLEIAWTTIPLLVFLGIFAWAAHDYTLLAQETAGALPVTVVARQWMWKLEHANGKREINELHVPLGQAVQLTMTSQDVIHSFYVPAFRIKQDVVPGRYTTLRFTATHAGVYRLFCAEYCGTDHAAMQGRIVVMPPAEFARWLDADVGPETTAARGRALFRHYGCAACHDAGATVQAPRLDGLMGRTVTLQDGRAVTADAAYVRDAILMPHKDIVAGYAPIMPTYQGQIDEQDILAIIEYLRSMGAADASTSR
ncbi:MULTISPECIES: cytochrome c oxidase subunit II [Cupriavidus]|uniref:Cytochrome c oxidase subunit 2 n=1 Tax=Cupriavidus pinatubonensis (strain JMP 134 / LMG 1197) TaxID=264198 RepID=Q46SU8_CUPPJ|nr:MULTISPECIES: cytochrome c oxidase subunit II [Cupriavidus]TPQ38047.1 cytochrome c oxidase subunit II [Cupriavidus pinatubonensis]